ncbi:hypothetical protein MMC28_008430 [Mycoblastus sanguinarius]|nr:hypothetical protein [Mycoblastus sanguinarius]
MEAGYSLSSTHSSPPTALSIYSKHASRPERGDSKYTKGFTVVKVFSWSTKLTIKMSEIDNFTTKPEDLESSRYALGYEWFQQKEMFKDGALCAPNQTFLKAECYEYQLKQAMWTFLETRHDTANVAFLLMTENKSTLRQNRKYWPPITSGDRLMVIDPSEFGNAKIFNITQVLKDAKGWEHYYLVLHEIPKNAITLRPISELDG